MDEPEKHYAESQTLPITRNTQNRKPTESGTRSVAGGWPTEERGMAADGTSLLCGVAIVLHNWTEVMTDNFKNTLKIIHFERPEFHSIAPVLNSALFFRKDCLRSQSKTP